MTNDRQHGRLGSPLRRKAVIALACGGLLLGAAALPSPGSVAAQPAGPSAGRFASDSGSIVISPVQQMSVVIETPGGVIHTDPTGGADRYAAYRRPDIILISHEHGEHYDPRTLEELAGPDTRIVVPPHVMERLPQSLRGRAVSLANGTAATLARMHVEALPSYGLSGQAARWHPRGRGNAYLVTVDGQRLYLAGSTEAVPEMLGLRDIDIAFLPLYPPYALGPEEAAKAASIMRPRAIYIYQYDSLRTRDDFLRRMGSAAPSPRVVAPDIR